MDPAVWQTLDDALEAYRDAIAKKAEGRVIHERAEILAIASDAALADHDNDQVAQERPPLRAVKGGAVESLPLDRDSLMRHAIDALGRYVESTKPQPPDPRAGELALFDQIVATRASLGGNLEDAVAGALIVIKARRSLATLEGA